MHNNFKEIKNHIAVSSLESPLHASRKDPKILTVTWFLGKRCNFDCSYCSSHTHDNFSPHIKKEHAINFIDNISSYAEEIKKEIKLAFTGGEPFVHPNILEILKYSHNVKNIKNISIVTNGSLPLELYQESSNFITNITISLHLEQNDINLQKTIEKILELNKIKKWFFNINLMFLPGKMETIKKIIHLFNSNNVKFILRKIDPPYEDKKTILKKKDITNFNKIDESFLSVKIKNKETKDTIIKDLQKRYYSQEEIDFFHNFKNEGQWNNIKLHFIDKKIELNTDELRARDLNSWTNWHCYIGIDSIYVQHDGSIFRGHCFYGGKIGNIGEKINWPKEPIVCGLNICECNADMVVRKIKDIKYKNLIDE
jgi:hypothetical protein